MGKNKSKSNPQSPPPQSPRRMPEWLPWGMLALALLLYTLSITAFFVPAYYAGVDEHGYFVQMRNFATRGEFAQHVPDPVAFVGENWVEVSPGVFYAKYPIGYPLVGAAAYKLAGPKGPSYINPVAMGLMLIAVFMLGRAMVSPVVGALAALALAVHGLTRFFGLASMSHALDICVVTWGMFFLWRWYQSRRWGWAVPAGFLLGYSISIRYSDGLYLLAPLALFVIAWQDKRRAGASLRPLMRDGLLFGAGALISLVPLFIHQTNAFGAPWKTGYGLTGESTSFSISYFLDHAPHAMVMLLKPQSGLFVLLPLGIVGLVMLSRRGQKAAAWTLGLWSVPTILLYMAYYWMPAGTDELYGRLFMTTYPAMVIAGFGLLKLLQPKPMIWQMLGVAVGVGICALFYNDNSAAASLVRQNALNADSATVSSATIEEFPRGSSIVSDKFYAYYLDYLGDYRLYYSIYFSPPWIAAELKDQAEPAARHDLNPLRASRFAAALANKSKEETVKVLKASLLRDAKEGREIGLIAGKSAVPGWQDILSPEFEVVTIRDDVQSGGNALVETELRKNLVGLYRIRPRAAQP